MLFFMLFIFFLVILGLFVVSKAIIDFSQNIGLKAVQIVLRDHVLRLLRVQRLWHWHSGQLCLSSDEVGGGEGLLEVGDLLLEYAVLAQELRVLFLQSVSLLSDSVEDLGLLVEPLLEGLLIGLLPLAATHG